MNIVFTAESHARLKLWAMGLRDGSLPYVFVAQNMVKSFQDWCYVTKSLHSALEKQKNLHYYKHMS